MTSWMRSSRSLRPELSPLLLNALVHAGFTVEGWDTNSGDKAVAVRVPIRTMTAADGAEFCQPEDIDGNLLKPLQEKAATITEDTVIGAAPDR